MDRSAGRNPTSLSGERIPLSPRIVDIFLQVQHQFRTIADYSAVAAPAGCLTEFAQQDTESSQGLDSFLSGIEGSLETVETVGDPACSTT